MSSRRTVIHPTGMTAESGAWSHASSTPISGSRLVFVAGQTAREEDGRPLPADDFERQFRRVYDNLHAVLHQAGASFGDIVSMRSFLTRRVDIDDFARLRNEVHADLFPDRNFPPNTLVVVEALAHPSLLLEVEAVAVVSG